jgi:hypothetical protein
MSEGLNTTPEEAEKAHKAESFLQMLYHHEQQQIMPVVDQGFFQAFRALDEEGQYKAMNHIRFLSILPVDQDLHQEVHRGRLVYFHKVWYEEQTEGWVYKVYEEPIEDAAWVESMARSAAKQAILDVEGKGGDPTKLSLAEAKELLG